MMKHYYSGKEAALGWMVVAGVVVAYEIVAPDGQLLSEGMDRALERSPILTRVAVAIVALHLLNLIPPNMDPLHRLVSFRKPLRARPMRVPGVRRSQASSAPALRVVK